MSTVAFGALTTRREKSDSGTSKSDQPPGLNSYIDILAALVPAEVLAIHAIIIAAVTTTNARGARRRSPSPPRCAWRSGCWPAGRGVVRARPAPGPTPAAVQQQSGTSVPRWQHLEWQDLIRIGIPPAAFVGWTMLEPASAWNVVVPDMSSGTRTLIALVGAVFLAAVTKALASHSDKKPSPASRARGPRGAGPQCHSRGPPLPPPPSQPRSISRPPRKPSRPHHRRPPTASRPRTSHRSRSGSIEPRRGGR